MFFPSVQAVLLSFVDTPGQFNLIKHVQSQSPALPNCFPNGQFEKRPNKTFRLYRKYWVLQAHPCSNHRRELASRFG